MQTSSWVASIILLCLTVFYVITVIAFCRHKRRAEVPMTEFNDEDDEDVQVPLLS